MKTFLSTLVLAIMAHSVSANATTSPIGRYLVVTLPQTLSMVLYRAAVVGELPPTVKVSSGKTSGIRYIDYCQSGEESNAPCSSLDHDGGSRWMRCYFFRSGPTCSIRILEANYIYIVPDAKDNASVVTFDQSKSRFFFEFLMTRKYSKQHKEETPSQYQMTSSALHVF